MLKIYKFSAPWCSQCKRLSKNLEQNPIPDVEVVNFNIEDNEEAVSKYNIMCLPTVILIKDETEVWRSSGVITINDIKEAIAKQA